MTDAVSILDRWDTFYVIIGSSSAALTGLMFVVVTLMPERRTGPATHDTVSAFATPTVVHLCAALLVSAILTAPWSGLWGPGIVLSVSGLAGFAYCAVVTRRVSRSTEYRPVFEDWLWHVLLPLIAYTTLVAGGVLLHRDAEGALYALGAATLLLLFIGIHNAWDTVTYIKLDMEQGEPKHKRKRQDEPF